MKVKICETIMMKLNCINYEIFLTDALESVKALQLRVGDKLAKEFFKKLKTKISDGHAR
jgi:hypothetical protein